MLPVNCFGELQLTSIEETADELNVEAYFSEDIYAGAHLEEAPDIVFVLDDGRCEIDAKVGDGRLFAEGAPLTGWKGTHTKDGVFMARGPGIKPGFRVEKAQQSYHLEE